MTKQGKQNRKQNMEISKQADFICYINIIHTLYMEIVSFSQLCFYFLLQMQISSLHI